MRKLLLGLIGLLFAVPAVATDLPAGYTELEYIESTGTQYIDTGVHLLFGDEFYFDYMKLDSVSAEDKGYGAGSNLANNITGGGRKSSNNVTMFVCNRNASYSPSLLFTESLIQRYVEHWKITTGRLDSTLTNVNTQASYTLTSNSDALSSSYDSGNNLFLFRDNSAQYQYPSAQRVYGTWLKRIDGNFAFNLVPAKRNSDGVVGMYDTVNNEFYTNQGTGEFTAGPEVGIRIATTAYNSARFSPVVTELNDTIATIRSVVTNTINQTKAIADLQATKQTRPNENCPAGKKCLLVEDNDGQPHWYEIIENAYGLPNGYTALEYLQSDGASYLIVPYRVNNKTVFYCRYNEIQNGPQTANAVFGVTTSPDVSKANNGILRLTGSNFDRMGWGNSVEGSIIDVNAPKEFNTWYEVLYDQNKLYQNDRLYATSATQTNVSWVAEYDLGVFARNSASVTMPAIAKISSVWAKENGEYKINLIPARRNSDNVIGMYDTVSGEFFTNKGTGTFTAGPEI